MKPINIIDIINMINMIKFRSMTIPINPFFLGNHQVSTAPSPHVFAQDQGLGGAARGADPTHRVGKRALEKSAETGAPGGGPGG